MFHDESSRGKSCSSPGNKAFNISQHRAVSPSQDMARLLDGPPLPGTHESWSTRPKEHTISECCKVIVEDNGSHIMRTCSQSISFFWRWRIGSFVAFFFYLFRIMYNEAMAAGVAFGSRTRISATRYLC